MTYYGGREMAAAFRTVRGNTIQIAEEIPEEQYAFKASPESRTVGQTLTHIAFGPTFQLEIQTNRIDDLANVNFPQIAQRLQAEEAMPRTKAEVLALLKSEGERFAAYLEGLTEAFLAEPVKMPQGASPATKSRFEMLLSPKEHEMHHRAQLMVVQRMIGLVPHITRQQQERMARAMAARA
jgi:uncharacterized damage-inducible protein DinB